MFELSGEDERTTVCLGVSVLVVVLGVLSLWLSACAQGAAESLPSQSQVPQVTLSDQSMKLAQQFESFADAIPVLSFSSAGADEGSPLPPISEIAQQMALLDEAGFSTVGLDDVRSFVMGRDVQLPAKPVLITFDGAGSRLWTDVDPILKEHGFTAAMFLTAEELVAPAAAPELSLDTLRVMRNSGRWDFGAHYSSSALARAEGESLLVWESRVRGLLESGKVSIESSLGRRPMAMSYPFHDSGLPQNDPAVALRLPELVGEQFDLGFLDTSRSIVVTVDIDKTMAPRIPQSRTVLSADALLGAIGDSLPRRPTDDVDSISWLIVGEGTCLYANQTLVIAAEGTTSCRLESTLQSAWENVTLSSIVDGITPGMSAGVRLRESAGGRIEVLLTSDEVLVQRQVRGEWAAVARAPLEVAERVGPQPLFINLQGSRIQVTLAGRIVIEGDVGASSGPGGLSIAATADDTGTLTMANFVMTSSSPA